MAKRFYWLKLHKKFFEQSENQILESLGNNYLLFYIKLLCLSTEDKFYPSKSTRTIARDTHESKEFVERAIMLLREYDFIRVDDREFLYVPYISKTTVMQSAEKEGRDRNSNDYKLWRLRVFERDNFTCQDCGERGGRLNAHHIKSWRKHPSLRFVTANGVTLCERCHKGRHKKEGVL